MRGRTSLTIVLGALVAAFSLAQAEPASPDSIVRVGACATPGITWGVFVQGDYAYVADRSALTIIDVSDSSAPLLVSTLSNPLTGAVGVFVADTLAYLHRGGVGIFSVINVSRPDSPFVLGWCAIPLSVQDPKGICLVDTLCYVARGQAGFVTINVAKPDSPTVINTFDTPGYAMDLMIQDTIIYVADRDSLQIVNIANTTSPQHLGSCLMPSACYDVFVVDTFAFVVCESDLGTDGKLEIASVSSPASPFIIDEILMNADPYAVQVASSYAYVGAADYWASIKGKQRRVAGLRSARPLDNKADVEGGLRIVDVADPGSGSLVASYDTPGDPRDLAVVGTLVYVADYDSLQILKHMVTVVEENPVSGHQNTVSDLKQNFPNPFAHLTAIRYRVSSPSHVSLKIYDVDGRLVRSLVDTIEDSGEYTVWWDGRDNTGEEVGSGAYFCYLITESYSAARKVLVVQ